MTEKLFYTDAHMRGFTAHVLSCEERGALYAVTLDRTAFFPEGGGQGGDGDLCCFFHGIGSSVEFLNRQGMVFYGKMKGNQPVVEVLLCLSM